MILIISINIFLNSELKIMDNFILQSWNVGFADVEKQRTNKCFDNTIISELKKGVYLFQEISDLVKNNKNCIFRNNETIIEQNKQLKLQTQPYGNAVFWTEEFKFIKIIEPSYLIPFLKKNIY